MRQLSSIGPIAPVDGGSWYVIVQMHFLKVCQFVFGSNSVEAFYNLTPMEKIKEKEVETKKVLSTSVRCQTGCLPQWTSESQLNYMSQYDFVTYDLEDDRPDLIERPACDQIISVKYAALLGQSVVRVIYLHKSETGFCITVIPSYNLVGTHIMQKIEVKEQKISCAVDFVYLQDNQAAIVPVMFANGQWGLVYTNLSDEERTFHLQRYFDEDTCFRSQQQFLKQLIIVPCKQPNIFLLIQPKSMELIKVSSISRCFTTLYKLSYTGQFRNPLYLTLCKAYLIGWSNSTLRCFVVDDDKIEPCFTHELDLQDDIGGIVGSSNKIVVWLRNRPILHQYNFNDIFDRIEFVNSVNLESEGLQSIDEAIVSESSRNVAVLSYSRQKPKEIQKQPSETKIRSRVSRISLNLINAVAPRLPGQVAFFLIFKLELYTELGINDNSLYVRYLRYTNRCRKVHKLILPRFYEQVYALTGSQIHTLNSHCISGVQNFDIHPYGFFMAVSYSFNIKIYSLEHNAMTLLYSISMHNIRKVLFTPDGAHIVLLSPRKIKFLDAFSFELKYQLTQKNTTITAICFSPTNGNFFILLEGGIVMERSFMDFQVCKTYRIFGHTHRKILQFFIHEPSEVLYFRLDDGTLISKNISNLTAPEGVYEYEDGQKISSICIEPTNNLLIMGTKSGKLRFHGIKWFKMSKFNEKQVNTSEITAIAVSTIENNIYVGNEHGDITTLRIYTASDNSFLAKSSKMLKTAAPKIETFMDFSFQLLSIAKMNGNTEQNTLQDKLEILIEKIQQFTNDYRKSMVDNYNREEQKMKSMNGMEAKQAYREYESKYNKLKTEQKLVKEKFVRKKKEANEEYEQKIKGLFQLQQELMDKKQKVQEDIDRSLRMESQNIVREERQLEQQLSAKFEEITQFIHGENIGQELFQNDDDDFHLSETDALRFYNKTLEKQLIEVKTKCLYLNKQNGYLETAKKNMLSRKIQEQTLSLRVDQELRSLTMIQGQQNGRIQRLGRQLKMTQELIHKIQNKVKNTPNNVISSDKADSDLCSYKIWMKEKVQQEVNKLECYLAGVQEQFENKSQDMVQITNETKNNVILMKQLCIKKKELKDRLKAMRSQAVFMKAHNDQRQKMICSSRRKQRESYNIKEKCKFDENQVRKITSIERIQEKALYFENKNIKIHTRKIKNLSNNCSELLKEYEKLKYQNKVLLDKQRYCLHEIHKAEVELTEQKKTMAPSLSERPSHYSPRDTPFINYIRIKSNRNNEAALMMRTATSTPKGMWASGRTSRVV